MGYRFGWYFDPQTDDRSVDNLVEAEQKAEEMSLRNSGNAVAVLNDKDRTIKLFADHEAFEPAR